MKNTFAYVFCVLFFGCSKEKIGHTETFINNTTAHTIKIMPFNGSTLDLNNLKVIPASTTIEIYSANVRGKTIDPCFGVLLQPYDSILIVYDDSIKIPHIKFNQTYSGNHKILFESNRSISNIKNYQKEITDESKNTIRGKFTYTFVEQDYLDAR